jgi:hypothetical protein
MGEVSTIGVDIAKSAFQINGVDADGVVVIRRRAEVYLRLQLSKLAELGDVDFESLDSHCETLSAQSQLSPRNNCLPSSQ